MNHNTRYSIGNITISKKDVNVLVFNDSPELNSILQESMDRDCMCSYNGIPTSLHLYMKARVDQYLDSKLKSLVNIHTSPGEYKEKFTWNWNLESNEFTINNIKPSKVIIEYDIQYSVTDEVQETYDGENSVLENRLICYFDLLGFKNIVNQVGVKRVHAHYLSLIEKIKVRTEQFVSHETSPHPIERFKVFFDSIVIVSGPTDSVQLVNNFIFSCIETLEEGFSMGFPMRGAITKGDYIDHKESNLFVSDSFNSLTTIEQSQNWCGCIISPEAEEFISKSIYGEQWPTNVTSENPLIRYSVPIKDKFQKLNPKVEFLCLNFSYFLSVHEKESGLKHMEGDKDKMENTRDFIDYVDSIYKDPIKLGLYYLKVMKSQSGFRYKYVSEYGQRIISNPPQIVSIGILHKGETTPFKIVI